MKLGGKRRAPAALPAVRITDTHCTGGWVSPRVHLDNAENLAPTRI
jgi:hypothetical protein